ncbi:MAG: hypothetical protein QM820_39065 [Minicystis sp.]
MLAGIDWHVASHDWPQGMSQRMAEYCRYPVLEHPSFWKDPQCGAASAVPVVSAAAANASVERSRRIMVSNLQGIRVEIEGESAARIG